MRKNILRLTLIAACITGTLLVLGSAKPPSKSGPCEESMEQCCKKKEKTGGTEKTNNFESLSSQFFASTRF
jgi:hypothetical protein